MAAIQFGLAIAGLLGMLRLNDPPAPADAVSVTAPARGPREISARPVEAPQATSAWDAAGRPVPVTPKVLDDASRQISFQALLTDDLGDPLADGLHTLDFFLYRGDGIELLGSVLNVPVTTAGGIASTQVGPLDSAWFEFDGLPRYLGLTVDDADDNPTGDETTPRTLLTAVPYAFRVDRVASPELVDDLELGDSQSFGRLTVWDGLGERTIELDGVNNYIVVRNNSGDTVMRGGGGGYGFFDLMDEVGNETTIRLGAQSNSGGQMELFNSGGSRRYLAVGETTGGTVTLYDSANSATILLDAADAGQLELLGGYNVVTALGGTVLGKLNGTPGGGNITIYNESGQTRLQAGTSATDDGGFLFLRDAGGSLNLLLDGDDGGAGLVEMDNAANFTNVVLDADSGDGGALFTLSDGALVTIDLDAKGGGGGAGVTLRDNTGFDTIVLDANEAPGAAIYLRDGTRTTIELDANGGGGGAGVILTNSAGVDTIVMDADSSDAALMTLSDGVRNTIDLYTNAAGGGAAITLRNSTGFANVLFDSDESDDGASLLMSDGVRTTIDLDAKSGTGGGGLLLLYNSAGTNTIAIDADFGADNDGRIITQELQITGGSDLSEQFDVSVSDGAIEPGMVVCIDAERPGALVVCHAAYDSTVAGVVSGAGGVKPGMLMGHSGTLADGEHPIALTGRVFVWCDASNSSVAPGDLLTTSQTRGHAMRVTQHSRASGAIIGKAMTSLKNGRGLVLVLVSLQ